MIITVGWAIYPLGYVFGYLTGGMDANTLNVIYNLADFLNKVKNNKKWSYYEIFLCSHWFDQYADFCCNY
jgi:hypothetical protein